MKNDQIKSGIEILDDFFVALSEDDECDTETRDTVVSLFHEGKLTAINIENALRNIREDALSDED